MPRKRKFPTDRTAYWFLMHALGREWMRFPRPHCTQCDSTTRAIWHGVYYKCDGCGHSMDAKLAPAVAESRTPPIYWAVGTLLVLAGASVRQLALADITYGPALRISRHVRSRVGFSAAHRRLVPSRTINNFLAVGNHRAFEDPRYLKHLNTVIWDCGPVDSELLPVPRHLWERRRKERLLKDGPDFFDRLTREDIAMLRDADQRTSPRSEEEENVGDDPDGE